MILLVLFFSTMISEKLTYSSACYEFKLRHL